MTNSHSTLRNHSAHALTDDVRYQIAQEWLDGQSWDVRDLTDSDWFTLLDRFSDGTLELTALISHVWDLGGTLYLDGQLFEDTGSECDLNEDPQ